MHAGNMLPCTFQERWIAKTMLRRHRRDIVGLVCMSKWTKCSSCRFCELIRAIVMAISKAADWAENFPLQKVKEVFGNISHRILWKSRFADRETNIREKEHPRTTCFCHALKSWMPHKNLVRKVDAWPGACSRMEAGSMRNIPKHQVGLPGSQL